MVKRFSKSLIYAFNGLKDVLIRENNFKIMLIVAVATLFAMFYFPTEHLEKAILLVMIFVVLILELINTVIERIMDFIHSGHHEQVRNIKDLMAAIVLIVSIGAAVIGLFILSPYF